MISEGSERRRAHRVRVPGGRAVCHSSDGERCYDVRDASRQGVCLEGAVPLRHGAAVVVDLTWPGIGHARCGGRVVRTGRRRRGIGICFSEPDRRVEELIDELSAAQSTLRAITAMIYTPDPALGDHLGERVSELGARAVRARTSLEVLWRFHDCRVNISALVFDASPSGCAMARFVRDEFPYVRRVLVARPHERAEAERARDLGSCDQLIDLDVDVTGLAVALGAPQVFECAGCGDRSGRFELAPRCVACSDRGAASADHLDQVE